MQRETNRIEQISGVLDALCIALAFVLAGYLVTSVTGNRLLILIRGPEKLPQGSTQQLLFVAVTVAIWLVIARYRGIYERRTGERFLTSVGNHLQTLALWIIAVGFVVFTLKLRVVGRPLAWSYFSIATLLLMTREAGTAALLGYLARHGAVTRALIVGERQCAERFARLFLEKQPAGYELVGIVPDEGAPLNCANGANGAGNGSNAAHAISSALAENADEIFLVPALSA